ncbi:hypothetical protein F4782DRAFT_548492 [Xylaria castorea]|nr:hypothetical protein F4782DRAFT_548492 [Xylaria castorea]
MPPLSLIFVQWQPEPGAAYACYQRDAAVRHNSYIEGLPAELQLLVIENLPVGDLRSIINLALTGPVYYHLVSEYEASLAENVVVSAVGRDVMPIAATLYELEALGDKLPRLYSPKRRFPAVRSWNRMLKILDRHTGRHSRNWHTQSRITKFSVAASYLQLDVAVRYWAKKLANRALAKAYSIVPRQRWRDDPKSKPGPNPKPTATEMSRFYKALYIYQLQSVAFPWPFNSDHIRSVVISYYSAFHRFWHTVPPWEFEQVRQVEVLLGCDQLGYSYLPYPVVTFSHCYSSIFEQGLTRMRVLDALRPWPLGRVTRDELWEINNPYLLVRMPAIPGEYMPMDFDFDENRNTNLHAGGIFKQYPEGDDGPKFWWYYSLLMEFPRIQMKHKYSLTSACRNHSFMLGYVFWDFERLRKMTREECPSIDDLLECTRGVSVNEGDIYRLFGKHSGLHASLDGPCDCMIGKVRY